MTIKEKLLNGTVVNAHIQADLPRNAAPKSKTFTATRLPGGYKALIEVQTKAGLVNLEIDAPTARAIAAVFGDEPEPTLRRCGTCDKPGHNSRTCPGDAPAETTAAPSVAPLSGRKCGVCDKPGHNSRTCPDNK